MESLLLLIDRASAFVGKLFAWCVVVLTGAVGYEVFVRYLLGAPTVWAYDAASMLYGALFVMAGAYTLSRNGHIRADFLYRLFRPRVQAGVDLALYVIVFLPGVVALLVSGYGFAELSWRMNEHSSFSPAGPPLYHFKSLIPIAGLFLLMQGVAETIRCILCLRTGRWPRRLRDVEELEKEILAQQGRTERAR